MTKMFSLLKKNQQNEYIYKWKITEFSKKY